MEAVVVSASVGAAGILLQKLGDLLVRELADKYTLLGSVRDGIQELKDEHESLTACLLDLDRSGDDETRSEQARAWMKQVRNVGYDADDCIDMFRCHLMRRNDPGDSGALARDIRKIVSFFRTLRLRCKLKSDIQRLRSQAQKVSQRRLRYKLDAAEVNYRPPSMLISYANVHHQLPALGDETRLVGMESNIRTIIGWLGGDNAPDPANAPEDAPDRRLRVISVVGSAGLGKTALALTVYNNPNVHGIQSRAFVSVSRTYDLRSLLESMVRQLYRRITSNTEQARELQGSENWKVPELQGIEDLKTAELITRSKEQLADKRYLVILDDIWNQEAWENLKQALPDNGRGSRIVITTRNIEVGKSCASPIGHMHTMDTLNHEDSKDLLLKTLFGPDNCPPAYHNVCNDILDKCKGLPLAIVSIGGMLAQRKHEAPADWRKLIARLGSELQINQSLERMRRILSLSYNDLPYHLKSCFLYLSVFPEGHEIRRGPLVRRWAAEGFISPVHDLGLEEIAQLCFDGFVSRSLVTPQQLASCGEVRSFKVHDTMLEVITSKSIQENFISFLGRHQHSTIGHDKIRRLSIQPGNEYNNVSIRSLSHVRSLTILGSTDKPIEKFRFSHLKLLRVLDLEGCRWVNDEELKDICKLSLLRYLSLRDTAIKKLPNEIGKLKALVTLDVRQTSVRELPEGITQLHNLNHLMAGAYVHYTSSHSVKHDAFDQAVKLPPGLSNMKSLQRLSFVDLQKSTNQELQEVAKLSQLTRLCVMQMNHHATWEQFGESLSHLSGSLRHLSVIQFAVKDACQLNFLHHLRSPPLHLQSLHLMGSLCRLPEWISSHRNLASLSFRETYLGTEMVAALGNLPSLVSLKLYIDSYTGAELRFEKDQFPSLKQLVIDTLWTLATISFQGGAPALERLSLVLLGTHRKKISGIEKLSKLRKVELYGDILDSEVNYVREKVNQKILVTREDHQQRPTRN
ncbi:hypothetical protein ACP70R_031418 [Stipagrostis hirtigluma subsp. patula]